MELDLLLIGWVFTAKGTKDNHCKAISIFLEGEY